MTHPITPVKLGGWEHLCGRGEREREREWGGIEEESKKRGGKKRGDGEEQRGVKDEEEEGGKT